VVQSTNDNITIRPEFTSAFSDQGLSEATGGCGKEGKACKGTIRRVRLIIRHEFTAAFSDQGPIRLPAKLHIKTHPTLLRPPCEPAPSSKTLRERLFLRKRRSTYEHDVINVINGRNTCSGCTGIITPSLKLTTAYLHAHDRYHAEGPPTQRAGWSAPFKLAPRN
jgi:hypothetical protein